MRNNHRSWRRGSPHQDFVNLVIEGKPVRLYETPEPEFVDELHPFDRLSTPDGTIYLLCSCEAETPARDFACLIRDCGHETWYVETLAEEGKQ